jgi:hypothetical protein
MSNRILEAAKNLAREDCLGAASVAPIVREACERLRGLRW